MHIYENICKTTQLFYVRLSSLKKISKKVDEFKKKSRKFRAILFTKFIEILLGNLFQALLEIFLNIFPFFHVKGCPIGKKNFERYLFRKIPISLFRNFLFFCPLFKKIL